MLTKNDNNVTVIPILRSMVAAILIVTSFASTIQQKRIAIAQNEGQAVSPLLIVVCSLPNEWGCRELFTN